MKPNCGCVLRAVEDCRDLLSREFFPGCEQQHLTVLVPEEGKRAKEGMRAFAGIVVIIVRGIVARRSDELGNEA
jgi:hypothetical protein